MKMSLSFTMTLPPRTLLTFFLNCSLSQALALSSSWLRSTDFNPAFNLLNLRLVLGLPNTRMLVFPKGLYFAHYPDFRWESIWLLHLCKKFWTQKMWLFQLCTFSRLFWLFRFFAIPYEFLDQLVNVCKIVCLILKLNVQTTQFRVTI